MAPAGLRSVVNHARVICFLDTALANAFVARWCLGTWEGSFRLRHDLPELRVPAKPHRTP